MVVPVFNGAPSLDELAERCDHTLSGCSDWHELILVNDGSSDDSWEAIARLAREHTWVRGIDLARNFGQHNALLAGIRAARGEVIVTMDDDLQNPPEQIPTLLAALKPDLDVVYGVPLAKRQRLDRRVATQIVVRGLRALGGRTAPMVSAFRAFRASVRDGFADYTGPDVSIDSLLTWRTERFGTVQVQHDPRAHGQSNYSLLRLVRHAMTMITAFSTRPLQIASGLGFVVLLFGIVVLVYVLIRFAVEGGSVPGFPFLASIISVFAGAQLFAIGVIGEYLARVHVRVMSKPSYEVRQAIDGAVADPCQESRVAADGLAELLAWDSEFWGFPVARLRGGDLSPNRAHDAVAWCTARGVRCAFLLTDGAEAEPAAVAAAAGFRAVDTRITLAREPDDPGPATAPALVRPGAEADREWIADLAADAHTDTRFFFDSRFPRERARELYRRWALRPLAEDGRELLVAEDDGDAVGYLIVVTDEPAIDLIAVKSTAQGSGVGTALVQAAIERFPDKQVQVVTQARNVAAMRLYESTGFRVVRSETWHHLWL